jgi:hypothetical protein
VTTVIEHQLPAPVEPEAELEAGAPVSYIRPVDAGLLVTLSSRMHCRAPMQLVDPYELPVYKPVHVDGTAVVSAGVSSPPATVDTYRCACGFTIDVPAASAQALAS